ncbi:MAG TPA: ASPIC/UnbV domain-containing protein [Terriglobales bacterium]
MGEDRSVALEIHWPSGTRQELKDVEADQILQITEPGSPADKRPE